MTNRVEPPHDKSPPAHGTPAKPGAPKAQVSSAPLPGRKGTKKQESAEEARRQRLLVARALILPTEFVLIPLLGLYAGKFLDHRWGTAPWLMVAGGLLGLAAAIRSLFETFNA